MSVNNFKQVRELLSFRNEDDFYFLQVLQRKKDFKGDQKVNGTNNNSRLVKAYYIDNLEYFDFIEDEVIKLCDLFNARAGINLNRRSYYKMHLQHQRKLLDQSLNGEFKKSHKAYSSIVGKYSNESDKMWIIDLDGEDETTFDYIYTLVDYISGLMPDEGEDKTICSIPSKNGRHLITRPFNLKDFKEEYPEVEVHKNNPTNLYIP